MRIALLFYFLGDTEPAAVTEVAGDVTDMVLPYPGDTVSHRDVKGDRFRARVVGRHFDYSLMDGEDVDGSITVTLSLEHLVSH